jgi:hypothetical protein
MVGPGFARTRPSCSLQRLLRSFEQEYAAAGSSQAGLVLGQAGLSPNSDIAVERPLTSHHRPESDCWQSLKGTADPRVADQPTSFRLSQGSQSYGSSLPQHHQISRSVDPVRIRAIYKDSAPETCIPTPLFRQLGEETDADMHAGGRAPSSPTWHITRGSWGIRRIRPLAPN